MKDAVLLHGKPGKEEYYDANTPSCSNYHWFPWLQKQLIVKDIKADTPEVPLAFDPQYDLWVKEVERFDMDANTTLVGHSCGGGFWLRYLSEHPELEVGRVVLVAPSLGLHWEDRSFFDFELDPEIVNRTKSLTIFYSKKDKQPTLDVVEMLKENLPKAKFVQFDNYGHFTHKEMPSGEFPELLEEILT